ncbi:MAG: RidA family protein [Pseudomonadota bacterium]
MLIERTRGDSPAGRNQSSSYKDLTWVVATARDESLDLTGQTKQALESLEKNLAALGSDKTRIISAYVFIADINQKPQMDKVWNEWIGANPEFWPQRACLGVDLGGHWLIEITVTAVRDEKSI